MSRQSFNQDISPDLSQDFNQNSPVIEPVEQKVELENAQKLLNQLTCLDRLPPDALPAPDQLRAALLLVANHSDYQIFGICAESVQEATIALHSYLPALGYDDRPIVAAQAGAVYVKYNPKTQRCHTDSYTGEHRGVLVSCQSAYDHDINGTFGHLPLNLFMTTL